MRSEPRRSGHDTLTLVPSVNLQVIVRLCGNIGGSRSSDYSLPTAIAITPSSILVS